MIAINLFFTTIILLFNQVSAKGYVVYCPCMGKLTVFYSTLIAISPFHFFLLLPGRFGNQADHFLGSLGFAKGINRTLILPPWVEYRSGEPKSTQVPFDTYFKVEKLKEFTDVITMEEFMETIGPEIWPPEKRISFCYSDRGNGKGCHAKEGNPFGPFWDTFNVDFVGSEKYGPMQFDVYRGNTVKTWQTKYPPSQWPVLAFVGAPASFPVQAENKELHQYLQWSDKVAQAAKRFIKNSLRKGGFIGIHLRNGIDWVRACEHVPKSPNLFAAPQCLGYRNEFGTATQEMCYPSIDTIVKHLKRLLRQMKDVKSIFVASDSNHMKNELQKALKGFEVSIFIRDPKNSLFAKPLGPDQPQSYLETEFVFSRLP